MTFTIQTPRLHQRVFENMLSPDNRTALDLVTNWTKEKLHRQQPEEKRAVDPDVVKYSSCFPIDMGDRKTFCIDHRWYEMECICPLDMSLPQKMPDCSIRIPGLNGSYESPVVNAKFVMIYGGEYYLFYVHRDFGLEEGLPPIQVGSQHIKEMTPGDVKIVRIRNQHCLVKLTSLDPGWPESGCHSPDEVIIPDGAPNLSPGLSFKGSYNGCLTTLKILKVYPPPEPHQVVHPKLTIISDENEEGGTMSLKDEDVFEIPGDRNRFCEIPDLDSPLACIFRGGWHTFRVCRQLRYIVRGMLVPDHSVCRRSRLSVLSAPRAPPLNRFSSLKKNITRVINPSGHRNNDGMKLRDVDALRGVRYQAPSPVHSSCAEQDAASIEDDDIYTDSDEETPMQQILGVPDSHQSESSGAPFQQPCGTFPHSSPGRTGVDADDTLRGTEPLVTQPNSQLGSPSGDSHQLVASINDHELKQHFSHKKSTSRTGRSSSIRISMVAPSTAGSKNRVPTTYREAVDLSKEVERMYNVLLGPLPVDVY